MEYFPTFAINIHGAYGHNSSIYIHFLLRPPPKRFPNQMLATKWARWWAIPQQKFVGEDVPLASSFNLGWIWWYWWWKKFQTTTWDVWNPVNNGINYQPQLVSLPDFRTINSTKFWNFSKLEIILRDSKLTVLLILPSDVHVSSTTDFSPVSCVCPLLPSTKMFLAISVVFWGRVGGGLSSQKQWHLKKVANEKMGYM